MKGLGGLRIRKPTVLRLRPSNLGVITYYFVGFGDTGGLEGLGLSVGDPGFETLDPSGLGFRAERG